MRNSTRTKTALTEIGTGVQAGDRPQAQAPDGRDRSDRALPQRPRVATGEIAAHFDNGYDATVSNDTISRLTEKVAGELADWSSRPLDPIYPVVFKNRGVEDVFIAVPDGLKGLPGAIIHVEFRRVDGHWHQGCCGSRASATTNEQPGHTRSCGPAAKCVPISTAESVARPAHRPGDREAPVATARPPPN
ncbi:transposase [Rhodococcus sp. T2V]|uniref:transposase n=1 Tax=Rhodococcus sp. T2V TaxID=3034164 RepID=UPI0031FEBAE1